MAEHTPQHGRRQHSHRGRRGPDRRGTDRRLPSRDHAPDNPREQTRDGGVDVEEIMREIRSRISQRHGIELSNQQIQELAARRLEAILEPRNVKPQLLEQLRQSAAATEVPASTPIETYEFDDTTLYETHRGILRFFRKLLHPILKLFFNPTPLIAALNKQARINRELASRELEREQRQSEWNALQYELLQRMVLETSRVSLEMQALANRIESLSAKVDFNERRVRGLESVPAGGPRPTRHQEPAPVAAGTLPAPSSDAPTGAETTPAEGSSENTRRRRRRRRGRRSGSGLNETPAASTTAVVEDDADTDEGEEDDMNGAEAPLAEVTSEAVGASPGPQPEEPTAPSFEPEGPREPIAPTPPHDEPTPQDPVDHADPGPVDR